jgi:phenylacetate-coenzyme A ligase PaaK-like adenylate-forming protein
LPFPLIHRIKGRESNWLVDKNGQKVFAVTSPFYDVPNFINGYQYVVHAPGKVTIKINPNKKNPDFEKGIEYIKDSYSKQYGNRFDFTYEIVDSIPHDDGKLRIIVFEK